MRLGVILSGYAKHDEVGSKEKEKLNGHKELLTRE
jgi:hypothetical protein